MSDREAFRLRRLFACLALLVCLILAYRPIPDVLASNDTGRYVASQEDACSMPVFGDDAGIQQWTFNVLVRPTCWSGGPRLFLLFVGMALPLALVAFGEWRSDGALLLAAAMFLSVAGFELETNALRQALSLAFLLAAISVESKLARMAALCIALLLHTSSWIFVPWVLLLNWGERRSWKSAVYRVLLALPLVGIVWLFLGRGFKGQVGDGLALLGVYADIYSVEVTRIFLIFMLLPFCWVFGVRWILTSGSIPREEKLTFLYSALLLAVTIIFFPMITYRVAMTAVILQLFMAMKAVDLSSLSAVWISGGLAFHFLIYAAFSPNVRAVFHG